MVTSPLVTIPACSICAGLSSILFATSVEQTHELGGPSALSPVAYPGAGMYVHMCLNPKYSLTHPSTQGRKCPRQTAHHVPLSPCREHVRQGLWFSKDLNYQPMKHTHTHTHTQRERERHHHHRDKGPGENPCHSSLGLEESSNFNLAYPLRNNPPRPDRDPDPQIVNLAPYSPSLKLYSPPNQSINNQLLSPTPPTIIDIAKRKKKKITPPNQRL